MAGLMRPFALSVLAAFVLSACASTNERGWTGAGATPFDHAKARCEIETQTLEGPAFERCMEALGWRRLP
jgi:hypothetical protein